MSVLGHDFDSCRGDAAYRWIAHSLSPDTATLMMSSCRHEAWRARAGNGAPEHVFGELFKMMTGVDMIHVPYRGAAPALTDLMAGQVQVMFATMPAAIEYVKGDRLRALAVTTATRSDALPNVPTVGEFVPGFSASTWYGVAAPRNTPPEIVDKLNHEINAAIADPKMKLRFDDLGAEPLSITPTEFKTFVVEETEKWGKVVKTVGIKVE